MQTTSAPVSGTGPRERIKPAEDVRLRWSWTEASVWTDRMLTALEQGVKGGRWHSLMDKVYSEENLFWSWTQVAQNRGAAGVDHVTIDEFAKRLVPNLKRLTQTLRENVYRPQDVKRVWIPKPGSKEQRPLGVPTVRDRVVQSALRNVLEPIFEKAPFRIENRAEQSYGFRPGRGCKDALRRVDQLMKDGYRYVVDADLKSYFDTIPHEGLMDRIREKISDGPAWPDCLATGILGGSTDQEQPPRRENPPVAVLALIEMFLTQGVLDGLDRWTPERGSPQGAVISPLLSNVYLNPLDHLLADAGYEMVRYADDFVILCRTAEQAQAALTLVQQWTSANGLTLHPEKTRLVNVDAEAFEFLGYSFFGEYRWPRKKSLQKLKETLRQKTKRTNGHSLPFIIADVNRTLRGWFEYFKHSHKWTFNRIDGWLRMRLRSILRKRAGRKGRGRGWDHHRWKNSFFAERGLFNLTAAHALACQSSRQVKPPTGEPCAGDPHARFGGRGG